MKKISDPIRRMVSAEKVQIKFLAQALSMRRARLKKLSCSAKLISEVFKPNHYNALYLRETDTNFIAFYPEDALKGDTMNRDNNRPEPIIFSPKVKRPDPIKVPLNQPLPSLDRRSSSERSKPAVIIPDDDKARPTP